MLGLPHVIDVLAWPPDRLPPRRPRRLKWSEVGEHAIVRTALKKSRGRRRRAVIPILPPLASCWRSCARRPRAGRRDGAGQQLRAAVGQPVSLGDRFAEVRDHAGIVEPPTPSSAFPSGPSTSTTARHLRHAPLPRAAAADRRADRRHHRLVARQRQPRSARPTLTTPPSSWQSGAGSPRTCKKTCKNASRRTS
jgi:hypothetical protein